jgi:Cupin domain
MTGTKSFTRIATDTAGGSTFHNEEILLDTPLAVAGVPPLLAGTIPAVSAAVYVRADMSGGAPHPAPHTTPRQQWVVMLRGVLEVEVTDGSRRTFGPGDLVRAEDTDGAGHITRFVGDPPFEALFLPG